ncbi:hypothetical protein [Nocardiopsis xinjiangensis]|uniref:hypothetical protein n=1 Tax=Nocardiopsis xinjiangensis TaxID=124285 RepID=UPI0003494022|nr:hypothetical protein [Nocardiopsis xinjiangensis]
MPTASTTPPSPAVRRRPGRLRTFGAAFAGSTLIAVTAAPGAWAASTPTVALESSVSFIGPGESAGPNPVNVTNPWSDPLCLFGLSASSGAFSVEDHGQKKVAPGESLQAGSLNGTPEESTSVTATLAHALADEEGNCPGGATDSSDVNWSVTVTEPPEEPEPTEEPTDEPTEEPPEEPEPTEEPTDEPTEEPPEEPEPTEEPTDEPTEEPPEEPEPTEEPTESDEPTEEPTDTPTETDRPTATPTDGGGPPSEDPRPDPEDGSRSDGTGSTPQGGGGGSGSVDSPPTSDADIPTLPRDDADLPDISPEGEDLAELPLVSPGQGEKDDDLDGTEVASDHDRMGAGVAPAALLGALLVALLLATPIMPSRRVRTAFEGGYQGKRRKG